MLFVALMPAVIISLTLTLYFIVLRYNDADAVLLARGATLARQLAPAAEYGAFSGNLAELQRLAAAVAREEDVTAVVFHDRDGKLLVGVGNPQFTGNARGLPRNWQGRSEDDGTLFFHAAIQRTTPAFDDPFAQETDAQTIAAVGHMLPLGSVTLEMSRSAVVENKKEILIVTILFSLGALAAGILLSRRLSRDVTEPILALQQTVTQIHLGNLDARVAHHQGQALRGLEEGVNEMAAALQAGRDHLEQRITEATLELRQKKEEAEHTSQAKSRFLAAASHDLRQPLHALTLFTDQLEQQSNTLGQRRLLLQVRSAVDALNEQLSALLDISRIDLGDIRTHPEPIALEPLIERVIAVHAPDAQAKGLRLRHVPTKAWATSDPRLLERMLGNLLSNAVRYTHAGGIVVGVRHCGSGTGAHWRLEVWDSGIGISDEQIPLIFQEFYQVENPERDADKGLGLGLAIVARLAQILDHHIAVRSRPGDGSVFSLTLPRTAPASALAAQTTRDNQFGFDIDVLVIGESADERDLLCGLLDGWGCRATCAVDVAADTARSDERPDVLIFDASRRAAVAELVGRYATPPILIMLGEASDGGLLPAMRCAQLALPLRPARLRALLQQLLQTTTDGASAT